MKRGKFENIINRSDVEVSDLIERAYEAVHEQGECDQGDVVVLDWDQTADLVEVARRLWREYLDQEDAPVACCRENPLTGAHNDND